MTGHALGHIRILDCSQFVAGPYCAKLLADLGAEVIKVEPPGGDVARRRGPFWHDVPSAETSGLFLYLNTGKLGVTLDLGKASGRDILRRLAGEAGILVEDFPPGTLEGWGLGYESLCQNNHSLIMTSITPFGQSGPYCDYKAYYLNSFHSGGEGYLTPGWAPEFIERPPLRVGNYVGEYVSGLSAAVATLSALYRQRATGVGQHIDISKQEALIALNPSELNMYPNYGLVASRASRVLRFGGLLPCRDGYIEVSIYGEVKEIDAAEGRVLILYYDYDTDNDASAEIIIGEEAEIENVASLADIEEGDWVDVTYNVTDGRNMAALIIVEKEEALSDEGVTE